MMISPRPLTHVLLALFLVACIWNVTDLPSLAISGKSLAQGTESGVAIKRFLSAENVSPDSTITQVDAVMSETFAVGVKDVDVDIAAVKKQPSVPIYLIDAIGSPPLDTPLPIEKSTYIEPAAFMPGPTINQADGVNSETMVLGAPSNEVDVGLVKDQGVMPSIPVLTVTNAELPRPSEVEMLTKSLNERLPVPTVDQVDGANPEMMVFGAQNSEVIMPAAKNKLPNSFAVPPTSAPPTPAFTEPFQPIGKIGITTTLNTAHPVPQKVVKPIQMEGAKDEGSNYTYGDNLYGDYPR